MIIKLSPHFQITLDIEAQIMYNEPVFQESEITVQIRVSGAFANKL